MSRHEHPRQGDLWVRGHRPGHLDALRRRGERVRLVNRSGTKNAAKLDVHPLDQTLADTLVTLLDQCGER